MSSEETLKEAEMIAKKLLAEYNIGGVNYQETESGVMIKDEPEHCDYIMEDGEGN